MYGIHDFGSPSNINIHVHVHRYSDVLAYPRNTKASVDKECKGVYCNFDFITTLAETGRCGLVATLRNLPIQRTHQNKFASIASFPCISEIMDKEKSCTPELTWNPKMKAWKMIFLFKKDSFSGFQPLVFVFDEVLQGFVFLVSWGQSSEELRLCLILRRLAEPYAARVRMPNARFEDEKGDMVFQHPW